MPVHNPSRGKIKVHLRMNRQARLWQVCFKDAYGGIFSLSDMTWMTRNSFNAKEAQVWAAERNARIITNMRIKRRG